MQGTDDRRHFTSLLAATLLALFGWLAPAASLVAQGVRAVDSTTAAEPSAQLDLIARRAFRFFVDHQHPVSGLVLDRARNDDEKETRRVASIAATGFGLACFVAGVERGWMSRDEGIARCARTLRFARDRMHREHGFWYHFVDHASGERRWKCEISSIDSALFIAGALIAGSYFSGSDVETLATKLFRDIDFRWMLDDGGTRPESDTLCMGWKPESGFLGARWSTYCELVILELLAIGSPSHAIPSSTWRAWKRPVVVTKHGDIIAGDLPLFVHQYSNVLVDLRDAASGGIDLDQNTLRATRWQQDFAKEHATRFRSFEDFWGVSASDGPKGYRAYAPRLDRCDGTVCLSVALTAIEWLPQEEVEVDLRRWLEHPLRPRILGRYGFVDAFNVDEDWFGPDVLGITLGPLLIAIENRRSGLIRSIGASLPPIRRALIAVGKR